MYPLTAIHILAGSVAIVVKGNEIANFHLGPLRPEPFSWLPQSLLGSSRGRRRYVITHWRLHQLRGHERNGDISPTMARL